MKIILLKKEFELLNTECELFKRNLNSKIKTTFYDNSSKIKIEFSEETFFDLLDWIEDNLDTRGFDINYELNNKGVILENILDKFIDSDQN